MERLLFINLMMTFLVFGCNFGTISPTPFPLTATPIVSTPTTSNTYYVATTGSDTNPGTLNLPWQTIQMAANTVKQGDTILIQEGNYNERVTIKHSGTADAPITFQAQGSVSTQGFTILANYITIRGFDVTNTPDNQQNGIGIFVQGNNCILENNYIHYATRGGIHLNALSNSCSVLSNKLYRNAHYGMDVRGQNHLIEGNEIWGTIQYHPNWINPPLTIDADGIRFFGYGHTFRSNHIHDISLNDSENIAPHIDAFQTWDNPNAEVANNILFEKNIIALHEGTTGWQIEGPAYDLTIKNNVVEAWDAGIRGHSTTGTPYNLLIVNNIFIGKLFVSAIGVTINPGQNVTFKNNIIFEQTNKTLNIMGQGNSVSNNLAYNSNGTIPPAPGILSVDSLWGVNPFFVNQGTGDFHLKVGSPAIDAGTSLLTVKDDFDGIARPQDTEFDIGPYEYSR